MGGVWSIAMSGNTFGHLFRVTTAGESHGPGNVVIVDGVPPGLGIDLPAIEHELARRRPGQSHLVSQRSEQDQVELLSGVLDGRATGAPLAMLIRNEDARSKDYLALANRYRPGHADFTVERKYGLRDPRGGGRASARETVARVAAGAIAKLLLARLGVRVQGWVSQVGPIVARELDPEHVTAEQVESNPVRCPDSDAASRMAALIEAVRADGDSIGGAAVTCAFGVPVGWGAPVFDRLDADLAKALMSLPAVKGVEVGAGFGVAAARGSEVNDTFVPYPARGPGAVTTLTNRHGGVLGGISSGLPIITRCAVKPPSSLPREQPTVDREGRPTTVATAGRHDPCVLPRFVPVAEAMVAIVLADHALRQAAVRGFDRVLAGGGDDARDDLGGELAGYEGTSAP